VFPVLPAAPRTMNPEATPSRASRASRWFPPNPETTADASPSPKPTTRQGLVPGICRRPATVSASRASSLAGHVEPVAQYRCTADSAASTTEPINEAERAVVLISQESHKPNPLQERCRSEAMAWHKASVRAARCTGERGACGTGGPHGRRRKANESGTLTLLRLAAIEVFLRRGHPTTSPT
jgi:hypothetical protein